MDVRTHVFLKTAENAVAELKKKRKIKAAEAKELIALSLENRKKFVKAYKKAAKVTDKNLPEAFKKELE